MTSSDYRLSARSMLAGKWGMAIIATLIAGLLGGLITGGGSSIEIDEEVLAKMPESLVAIIAMVTMVLSGLSLVQFILGGVIRQGYAQFMLNLHDNKPAEVRDLFSQFDHFGKAFLLSLLEGIFVTLWTLLFIIPGIVAAYGYAMAPFIMQEHPELSPKECLNASKAMMQGHKGELFLLDLSFIGWALLNALTLGIGSLWLNPYTNAAHTAFYRSLCPAPTYIEAEVIPE